MSLLGVDVGTTGCKAGVFAENGSLLAYAYEEYDVQWPQPGWAEIDSVDVWERVKRTIARAAAQAGVPVRALAVSSMGEALVPVSRDRRILGPSILNFDARGAEYLPELARRVSQERLYRISGNTLGNQYSLPKLKWIQEHRPELYAETACFLPWGAFVEHMLGADPAVDYSLANRTLLFDITREGWSEEMLTAAGLDGTKLPATVPAGTAVGQVARALACELGLAPGAVIVTGAHDQCSNAVGCGVIEEGRAMYGMGTYICILPVFRQPREPSVMLPLGLNTEHHPAPGRYACFIYNLGGALVKWFRDTFAAAERRSAQQSGEDVYARLMAEMPAEPSSILALPHWAQTGPPEFIADSSGVLVGLRLETTRGDILKGLIESVAFYLKECVDALPATGIRIEDYRAVGGGSKSDAWVQVSADILGRPMVRPVQREAGILGAAILAGVGCGLFPSLEGAVEQMVQLDRTFEPDPVRQAQYAERFEKYRQLWPLMKGYLRG